MNQRIHFIGIGHRHGSFSEDFLEMGWQVSGKSKVKTTQYLQLRGQDCTRT